MPYLLRMMALPAGRRNGIRTLQGKLSWERIPVLEQTPIGFRRKKSWSRESRHRERLGSQVLPYREVPVQSKQANNRYRKPNLPADLKRS